MIYDSLVWLLNIFCHRWIINHLSRWKTWYGIFKFFIFTGYCMYILLELSWLEIHNIVLCDIVFMLTDWIYILIYLLHMNNEEINIPNPPNDSFWFVGESFYGTSSLSLRSTILCILYYCRYIYKEAQWFSHSL